MSSNKENAENDKKKKSRPRLSIKIFSGSNKKKDNLKKIHEEFHSLDGSYKTQNDAEEKRQTKEAGDAPKERHSPDGSDKTGKQPDEKAGNATKEEDDSDTSDDSEQAVPRPLTFRPGRRRSLSACADVQDTRIKIKSKDEEEEEEKDDEDQLSPLPCSSPTRSCLRGRSATFGYAGEIVESISRPRSVSFSPETVDPPPRNIKYRAWIEARSKPPPVNVKHEKHKQKMNQLKKVNMSDYLASRKAGGIMASTSSAFGGGGGGMMM